MTMYGYPSWRPCWNWLKKGIALPAFPWSSWLVRLALAKRQFINGGRVKRIFLRSLLLHAREALPVLEYDAGNQRDFYAQFILRTIEMRKFHRTPVARVMIGLALEHPEIANQLFEKHQQPRFLAMQKFSPAGLRIIRRKKMPPSFSK